MNKASSQEGKSWLAKLCTTITNKPLIKSALLKTVQEQADNDLINENTANMIDGVLNVHELRVDDVMVARSQMITVAAKSSLSEIISLAIKSGHSRFPVTGESSDEILGILMAKDLLRFCSDKNKHKFNLGENLRPAIFIPESKRLDNLLHEFRINKNHMAIVVDEYGGITGLITIEDVLEQIVGEIEDEYDVDDSPNIKQRPNQANLYYIKALTEIDEFNNFFKSNLKNDEVDTIGGLVLRKFNHLPKRDETINVENFKFKVLRSDNRRIYALEVEVLDEA